MTLDAPKAIEAVVAAARREQPDLTIVARARDARHATALYDLGVDDAVPEIVEASSATCRRRCSSTSACPWGS